MPEPIQDRSIRQSIWEYVAALGIWGWVMTTCWILGDVVTFTLFAWGLWVAPKPEGTEHWIWLILCAVFIGLVAVPLIAFHRMRIALLDKVDEANGATGSLEGKLREVATQRDKLLFGIHEPKLKFTRTKSTEHLHQIELLNDSLDTPSVRLRVAAIRDAAGEIIEPPSSGLEIANGDPDHFDDSELLKPEEPCLFNVFALKTNGIQFCDRADTTYAYGVYEIQLKAHTDGSYAADLGRFVMGVTRVARVKD